MGVGKELFVASNARSLDLIVTSCLPKISTLHKKKRWPLINPRLKSWWLLGVVIIRGRRNDSKKRRGQEGYV